MHEYRHNNKRPLFINLFSELSSEFMRNNVKHQNSQNNSASEMPQKLYRHKYVNLIEILHYRVNYYLRNILKPNAIN